MEFHKISPVNLHTFCHFPLLLFYFLTCIFGCVVGVCAFCVYFFYFHIISTCQSNCLFPSHLLLVSSWETGKSTKNLGLLATWESRLECDGFVLLLVFELNVTNVPNRKKYIKVGNRKIMCYGKKKKKRARWRKKKMEWEDSDVEFKCRKVTYRYRTHVYDVCA